MKAEPEPTPVPTCTAWWKRHYADCGIVLFMPNEELCRTVRNLSLEHVVVTDLCLGKTRLDSA
ncbi:MAG: hypothetical protein V3U65_07575 [Granulosicoccaceae bacterium]